jgi:hypothetical protein
MNEKLFGFPGGDWNENEFNEAMNGLIEKGLAKRVVVGNKEFFSINALGEVVSRHMHTDPGMKN